MKKLYEDNSYQAEFDAMIISCTKQDELYDIVLDQTCFFPCEGGQTCDQGTLNGIEIIKVSIIDDVIHHYAKEKLSGNVHGIIDFDHRYYNMQHHTAEHVLSGMMLKYYGSNNVGFHLGINEVTADYDRMLNKDQLNLIETKINLAIKEAHPVFTYYLDDYSKINYRSKLELDKPRLVEIKDIDLCACCAPHLKNTVEINIFKIIKVTKIKKGMRLTFLCGQNAFRFLQMNYDQNDQISTLLASKLDKTHDNVKRIMELDKQHLVELKNVQKAYIELKYIDIQDQLDQTIYEDQYDNELQLYLYNLLLEHANRYVLLICKDKFITNSEMIFKLLKRFGANGGGKASLYKGKLDLDKLDLIKDELDELL